MAGDWDWIIQETKTWQGKWIGDWEAIGQWSLKSDEEPEERLGLEQTRSQGAKRELALARQTDWCRMGDRQGDWMRSPGWETYFKTENTSSHARME